MKYLARYLVEFEGSIEADDLRQAEAKLNHWLYQEHKGYARTTSIRQVEPAVEMANEPVSMMGRKPKERKTT